MKKEHYLYPIIGIVLLMIASFIMQMSSKTTFDKSVGLQEIQDCDSFTREAVTIITLYKQQKVPFTYVQTQFDQINHKVLSFYQDLDASAVPKNQQTILRQLNLVVFATALDLKTVAETKGDSKKLTAIQKDLAKQHSKFEQLGKTYE